jgi:ABC-2 type transport system permease protein
MTNPAVSRRLSFGHLLRAEWTKLRSLRSTVWSLLLLVVLDLCFTVLFTLLVVTQWEDNGPRFRATIVADPTSIIMAGGLQISQLTVCVLGVMEIASEYSTGMIRASLLAMPRRLPMLAAKAAVFGLLVFVVGATVSFVSFFIGAAIIHPKASVALDDPGVLRAVVGGGLYLSILGLFALAIGAIFRQTAAGITAVIGLVLVLGPLAQLLSGDLGKHVYAYQPSVAGRLIIQAQQAPDDLLSPWQGYAVFVGYTALLLVIAAVLLERRDA